MTLKQLLEETEVQAVRGPWEVEIAGVAYDSRRVKPGEVFFALSGARAEGRSFIARAREAGAVAAVIEAAATPALVSAGAPATVVEVAEPRRALGAAAARWHGHPSRALRVAAVTGTNGKTTITWMIEAIARAAGRSTGLLGTTGVRFAGRERAAAFTTPEALELQGLLREMVDAGVELVALEASSHALAQRRTYGLECDVVAFTNLSQDHLDFHRTMDAYLDAKLMLFDGRNGRTRKRTVAVVNQDDPAAARVTEAAQRAGLRVVRVSGTGPGFAGYPTAARDLEVWIAGLATAPNGLELRVGRRGPAWIPRAGRELRVTLPLLGRYNAANAAVAIGVARALRLPERAIVAGLATLPAVPGRLERVPSAAGFEVVVDYAHTPDALERALAAAREHARGRLLLVFGAGGDRDRAKRPIMGGIAARASDQAWITNDNPRHEDPAEIAREILAGAQGASPARAQVRVELDRRAAIAAAIAAAGAGDLVLIAGKGHETTQTIGDRVLPFDDRAVAAELLAAGVAR